MSLVNENIVDPNARLLIWDHQTLLRNWLIVNVNFMYTEMYAVALDM